MKSYSDALSESVKFDNFRSLIDETILTLGNIRRGHIDKKKIGLGIKLCETILEGYETSKKENVSWGEFDAYKKYLLLEDSERYFKKAGLSVEMIIQQIETMKKTLENILQSSNTPIGQDQIEEFGMYLSKISKLFRRATNTNLMYVKAMKRVRE